MASSRGKRTQGSSSHSELFIDHDAEKLGKQLLKSSIIMGRRVVFTGMPRFITQLFNDFGWTHYLELDTPSYFECVRQFYANFRKHDEEDDHFHSMINGIPIPSINASLLNLILESPDAGVRVDLHKGPLFPEGMEYTNFLRNICVSNDIHTKLTSSKLTPTWQLIHLICISNLCPKFGDKYSIYSKEKNLFTYLYSQTKVNLGFLVLDQMWEVTQEINKRKPRSLAFGHVVTLIMQYYNIPFRGDATTNSSSISIECLVDINKEKSSSRASSRRQPPSSIPQNIPHDSRNAFMSAFHNLRRAVHNALKGIRNEARTRDRNQFAYATNRDPENPILRSMSHRGTFGEEIPSWLDDTLSESEPSQEPSLHPSLQSRRYTLRPHTRSARHSTGSLPTASSSIPEADSSSHQGGGNNEDSE